MILKYIKIPLLLISLSIFAATGGVGNREDHDLPPTCCQRFCRALGIWGRAVTTDGPTDGGMHRWGVISAGLGQTPRMDSDEDSPRTRVRINAQLERARRDREALDHASSESIDSTGTH